MRTNSEGMLVPAVSGEELTTSIPALRESSKISTHQFSNIPSAQMTPEIMLSLRQKIIALCKEDVSGVVIVHGTDTMEETAFFLDASLSNQDLNNKPVVLTGAMRSNDQYSSDGAANLLAAVQVAAHDDSTGRGVMLVMNNTIHAARHVMKMHTSRTDAFESNHGAALGEVNEASAQACILFNTPPKRFTPTLNVSRETQQLPRVDIVSMYTGADETQIYASIAAGARAIIVQAVGASSVNLNLYAAIEQALAQNIAIVIASRSINGFCAPVYGYKGGGKTLAQLGTAFAHDLPAHKARLYAQLLIANNTIEHAPTAIREGFLKLNNTQTDWNMH